MCPFIALSDIVSINEPTLILIRICQCEVKHIKIKPIKAIMSI